MHVIDYIRFMFSVHESLSSPLLIIIIRYIIYKAPKLNNIGTTGLEYIYIDSNGETSKDPNKHINTVDGVLANTLRPIFTTSMVRIMFKLQICLYFDENQTMTQTDG